MELKQAEKIAKAYAKIEKHHNDIITLESIVENSLKLEQGVTISISSKKQKDNKVGFDSDGSLTSGNTYMGFMNYIVGASERNDDCIEFKTELNDLLSLELIGFLIAEKRKAIDKELRNINK